MVITSTSNSQIVQLKKILSDKKFRTEYGFYCVEGVKLVFDALESCKVEKIFLTESNIGKFNFPADIEVVQVADKVFAAVSEVKTSQGIAALISLPQNCMQKPVANCLVLENLQDSGNIGTLLRSAVATDFSDVYLVNCADVYSPKVLRSAMSAHFKLSLFTASTTEEVFPHLADVCTVCADMDGKNVFEFSKQQPIALILGNEGNGISDFARIHSQASVSLPMKNQLNSLNVAVAGSVLMYMLTFGQSN